jgi:hypothetical protein
VPANTNLRIAGVSDAVRMKLMRIDLLLDMRLNEQISEPEYISKKCVLVNQKAELKGKLEAFERNRQNQFEPAIRSILDAKMGTILLAEGNSEQKRDFLKKSVRTFRWRRNRCRWSSKNHGIYWPNSIPHQSQNTPPAAKFSQN